jgi:hypothetical protein
MYKGFPLTFQFAQSPHVQPRSAMKKRPKLEVLVDFCAIDIFFSIKPLTVL